MPTAREKIIDQICAFMDADYVTHAGLEKFIDETIAAHDATLRERCGRLEKALNHLADRVGRNRYWILDPHNRNHDWRTVGEVVDELINPEAK